MGEIERMRVKKQTAKEIEKLKDGQMQVLAHFRRLGYKVVDVRTEKNATLLINRCWNGKTVKIQGAHFEWEGDADSAVEALECLRDSAGVWAVEKMLEGMGTDC